MIPRVAYFYWAGGPMPWICEQSLVSFQRHHPGWRVVLGSPEPRTAPAGVELEVDTITDPLLPAHKRSDVWRWLMLCKGGVYSDTDVAWTGSIEPLLRDASSDAWVTQDGGTPVPGPRVWIRDSKRVKRLVQQGLSIGVVAAREGSILASRAAKVAAAGKGYSSEGMGYQSHGTLALAPEWPRITAGLVVAPLPFAAFYSGSSIPEVAAIWAPGSRPRASAAGVHWSYGSPSSKPFLGAKSLDCLPDCAVRQALVG